MPPLRPAVARRCAHRGLSPDPRYNFSETATMHQYDYVIVGGGMTANAAARGIRDVDARGSIGIIAAEPHPPYARPPLSKGLWKGDKPESIRLGTEGLNVELHLER